MKKWLIIAIIGLGAALYLAIKQAKENEEKWKVAMNNVKAYDNELSAEKKQGIAYQLTISQLKNYQDSVLRELDETRKELKIKDKNLKSLQSVSSVFVVNDTIVLKDTIFKEPSLAIDTLFGDEWYSVQLGLKYPSTIAVKPEFKSKKHIIVSNKKETVNPPKKFFLFRWFQKKHTVVHVDVVEKNPYVQNETDKFIEIIR